MAVDKFPKLKELTLKTSEKGILSFVADGPIAMWAPVILVAPGAGETLPRVDTTTTTNDPFILGIAAGGTGDIAETGNAADAAGDVIDVIPIHSGAITKVVVDGAATAIAVGDMLVTDATAGQAEDIASVTADTDAYPLGKAMQISTVNGDTILVFMGGSR